MIPEQGALLSLNGDQVLVGVGKPSWHSLPKSQTPSFYFPDFFLESSQPWATFDDYKLLKKKDLDKISQTAPCNWKIRGKEFFISSNQNHTLQKIVPYLFFQAKHSISKKALFSQAAHSALHLYGLWDHERGFLGATPETLFTLDNQELSTMACAGTGVDREILHNSKIQKEHEIVTFGIRESLHPFGCVTVQKTAPKQFGPLWHLITPIKVSLSKKIPISALVQALHPTPALGAYPKQLGLKWLKQYDALLPRGRFGAPAGLYLQGQFKSVVSIRQVKWEKNQLTIPVGCGVTSESVMEQELQEAEWKKQAILQTFF